MRKQYLHLSVSLCDKCNGPVVSGSLAVRESEISKETNIRPVGDMCLACGHSQRTVSHARCVRHFLPVEWQPVRVPNPGEIAPRPELDLASRK